MLTVWKNALELFVWNKHHLSKDHEFAVVILRDKAEWVRLQSLPNNNMAISCLRPLLVAYLSQMRILACL